VASLDQDDGELPEQKDDDSQNKRQKLDQFISPDVFIPGGSWDDIPDANKTQNFQSNASFKNENYRTTSNHAPESSFVVSLANQVAEIEQSRETLKRVYGDTMGANLAKKEIRDLYKKGLSKVAGYASADMEAKAAASSTVGAEVKSKLFCAFTLCPSDELGTADLLILINKALKQSVKYDKDFTTKYQFMNILVIAFIEEEDRNRACNVKSLGSFDQLKPIKLEEIEKAWKLVLPNIPSQMDATAVQILLDKADISFIGIKLAAAPGARNKSKGVNATIYLPSEEKFDKFLDIPGLETGQANGSKVLKIVPSRQITLDQEFISARVSPLPYKSQVPIKLKEDLVNYFGLTPYKIVQTRNYGDGTGTAGAMVLWKKAEIIKEKKWEVITKDTTIQIGQCNALYSVNFSN